MNSYLKAIAVPKEHGGWGFIAEGVIVGLCLAFTLDGLLLSLLFIVLFLLSQPLKIYVQDLIAKKNLERTKWARSIAFSYFLVGFMLFLFVSWSNQEPFWIPLIICLGLSLFQFIASVLKKEKIFFAEILGASAIALVTSAILIAGGKPIGLAFIVWALIVIRIVTSIVYVRNRLNKSKSSSFSKRNVIIAQVSGFIAISIIVYSNKFLSIIIFGFLILMGRAIHGMSGKAKDVRPQRIGVLEIVFGLVNSVCIIIGVG